MFGEAVALPAQLLQLLGPEGVTQQVLDVARCIEAGAITGLQHVRRQAVRSESAGEGRRCRPLQRNIAQDQRSCSGLTRACRSMRCAASSAASRSSSAVPSGP